MPAIRLCSGIIPAGIALTFLAACGGGGGSTDMVATSTLRLDITDAPMTDATKVWLQFTGVEVKPVGGMAQTFMFSTPKGYDLLTLQNGNAAMLQCCLGTLQSLRGNTSGYA